MRYIYNLLFYLFIPFEILRLLCRSIKDPAYRLRWNERFGFFDIPSQYNQAIWIHAVSMGETFIAIPIIREIQKRHPNIPIVITTTTPTGSNRAKTTFQDTVFHIYMPYDLHCIMKRFIKRLNPRLVIIMERELWPNLVHYCHQYHIPTLLANARLFINSIN